MHNIIFVISEWKKKKTEILHFFAKSNTQLQSIYRKYLGHSIDLFWNSTFYGE